ncbi:MAG: hypothetical protein CR971_00255 [candidate division SR1 bacterium]|nr:MAG: hypothetical protein CR971_00255 [candidate division SR1 bacterium]
MDRESLYKEDIKILYSAEQNLTIPVIKSGNFQNIPGEKYFQLDKWIKENTISIFSHFTNDIPIKFQKIRPQVHFVHAMGDISLLSRPILGIVGPRKNTPYADQVLQKLFEKVQQYNLVTISGLARGVDALCHKYSIQNNIPTIAVLGGGLKRYVESRSRAQIESIISNGGLVLSEFKLDLEPNKYTFPQRNRLIAGLSDVMFLPEANEKSGSLITANYALQYQIPICVAPNTLFQDTSKGTNNLLIQGKAKSVDLSFSFLETYFSSCHKREVVSGKTNISQIQTLSDNEQKIYQCIVENTCCDVNIIANYTQLDTSQVLDGILLLELNNLIYENTPNTYKICC